MKIFITGIDGVLGSTLKNKLRSQGHSVFGCSLAHSEDPQIVRADVSESRQLQRALDAFNVADPERPGEWDVVFHFAAEFGRLNGEAFYENLWKTNCIGTRNVIEECIRRQIKMVFASSSEAYGLSEDYNHGHALSEDMLDHHPPRFHNEYALSKYTNERQITLAARNRGLDAIILRFFNVYGPPERFSPYRSVACQFAYKILAGLPVVVNREGWRSHLWIGDWADTVSKLGDRDILNTLALNKYWPGSQNTPYVPVFNIGSDQYESIEGLYEMLVDIVKPADPQVIFIDREVANSATKRPDLLLAKTWLGHDPKMPFREGLERTVDWLRLEYGF
jgi:dTDP-glucose 4,6-dehydratase